jgi:hypothetical protein
MSCRSSIGATQKRQGETSESGVMARFYTGRPGIGFGAAAV